MSGGKVPLRLISLILLCSLIYPAQLHTSPPNKSGLTSGTIALPPPAHAIKLNHYC